jgi:hypothetical protein
MIWINRDSKKREVFMGSDPIGLWGGLSAVALTIPGGWVIDSLFSNVRIDCDDDAKKAINLFNWQYFINYNIPGSNGLYFYLRLL